MNLLDKAKLVISFFSALLPFHNEEIANKDVVLPTPPSKVLAAETSNNIFNFQVAVPALFKEKVEIRKDLIAPNIIYSIESGTGVSVSKGQDPKISLNLLAGAGISVSGATITNTGITSLTAGTGISISGSTITNAGITSLTAGTGISIDGSKITNTLTPDYSLSGWTDSGTTVGLSTLTDAVVMDTITFGNATITNGKSFKPNTDLGSDLGSASYRFNNLWVANINSNSSQSFSGQTTFSYAPLDTTIDEASVLINPTDPVASSTLLGFGNAGYMKAGVDAEGDLTIGYSDATSYPASDYPLNIYGHSGTRVGFVNTSGGAYFAGNVGIGTTSTPTKHLEVYGNSTRLGAGSVAGYLYFGLPASTNYFIYDHWYMNVGGMNFGVNASNPTNTFNVGGNTSIGSNYVGKAAPTNGLIVEGNVGIGTTAPNQSLEIGGSGKLKLPQTNNAASPTLQFGDGDTGIYENSDNVLTFTTAGNFRLSLNSAYLYRPGITGAMSISMSASSSTIPSFAFYLDEDTGLGRANADIASLIAGGVNVLNANSSGYVGIGTTSPDSILTISNGNPGINLISTSGSTTLDYIYFSDSTHDKSDYIQGLPGSAAIKIFTGGSERVKFGPYQNETVFNDIGQAYDFRIEGDTDANLFFVDASADKIGIGTSLPNTKLDISASGSGIEVLRLINTDTNLSAGPFMSFQSLTGGKAWGYIKSGSATSGSGDGGFLSFWTRTKTTETVTEKIRINELGYLGIGTSYPAAALSVGTTNQFQVDIEGNITKINNVTYSWPGTQGSASTVLTNNGSGVLSWSAPAGSSFPSITENYLLSVDGSGIVKNSNLLMATTADGFAITGGVVTPDGITPSNVATTASVTASSVYTTYVATNSNDGATATSWMPGNLDDDHYVTFDLGSEMWIDMVKVYIGNNVSHHYHKYTIETSSDNINWTEQYQSAAEEANRTMNEHPFASEVYIRYVRVTGDAISSAGLSGFDEVQIWTSGTTGAARMLNIAGGNINLNQSLKTDSTVTFANLKLSGNMGVGTTSPSSKLAIAGGVAIGTTDSFANSAIASNNLSVQGDIGIGTTSPTMDLDIVSGAAYSRINAGDANFTSSSSRSIKENFSEVSVFGILDKMAAIPVYTYDYIEGPKDRMGLIAEDFFTIFGRGKTSEINYQEVSLAMWMGIQELNSKLKEVQDQMGITTSLASVTANTDLSTTDSASLKDLTVSGVSTLGDTTITGNLTTGLLNIDGTNNTINATGILKLQDMALGDIEIMGGKVKFDTKGNIDIKQGVVMGNSSFRGNIEIPAGSGEYVFSANWDKAAESINITPSWNTNVWVDNITTTGFTIHFSTPPTEPKKIFWNAIF